MPHVIYLAPIPSGFSGWFPWRRSVLPCHSVATTLA